jgi:hypothetical protein
MNSWPAKPRLRASTVNWHLAVLVLAVGVCAAPFLGQPFHIDDNFYMDMARNTLAHPWHPNDTQYIFEGRLLQDMGSHSHPPLQTYFLAILQKCFGEGPGRERIYHSCALIYPILAVVSFYFLAARFVARPLWPALTLACSPLFLIMQHSLMTDVPTLSLWLAAVSTFIYAVDTKRGSLYAASGVFQFAAMFASYQAAALAPLLGFYQVKMRGDRRGWLALAAPPAMMAGWFGMNLLHYHRLILGDTIGYIQSRHGFGLEALGRKLTAILEYQGWLIIFPFFLICVFARGLKGRVFSLSLFMAACVAQLSVPRYRLVDKGIYVIGLVAGAFVFLRMGSSLLGSLRARDPDGESDLADRQFLGLWYLGVVFYCIFILTEGSARYLLPLAPPLLIVFFQSLEALEITEYRASNRPFLSSAMIASGSIVVSLAWGLLLSHADLEFARVYPRAAQEVSKITGGMESYFGGEWGFRYYFRQAGFKQLPPDEAQVRGGSWLVRPKLAIRYEIPHALESMTMPAQQTFSYELNTPLRLLDRWTPAAFYSGGFYSMGPALIPFSISYRALEEVEVRQVNFLVENLPRAIVEGGATVRPWPGIMELQEKNYLSILAKPSTRILYPWFADETLSLELKCGVGMEGYVDGQSRVFTFGVRQLGSGGTVLAGFSKSVNPGLRKEDRGWQPVRLLLQRSTRAPLTLELSFESEQNTAAGTGAFAEAFLRKP